MYSTIPNDYYNHIAILQACLKPGTVQTKAAGSNQ
jgi:hypothetical protein